MADRTPRSTCSLRRAPRRRGARDPRHRAHVRATSGCARTSPAGSSAARLPARELAKRVRRARPARDAPDGLRLRRHQRDGVRPGLPWSWRPATRAAQPGVGAGLAGDVRDPAATAARSRSRSGCRGWRPARRSAASGSPSPTSAPTPAAMRTRARRDGADWVLDGTKMWITNGSVADVAVVWARTDDGIRGLRRPDGHAGLHRATRSSTSCRCARRSPASWCSTASGCPADAMLPGGARAVGAAVVPDRGAVRHRLRRARRRPATAWRPRIAYAADRARSSASRSPAYQLTQAKLADMAVELGKGMLLALHLGRLKDARPAPARAGQHRQAQQRPRGARRSPGECRTILGANGITPRVPGAAARQQPRVGADLRGHRPRCTSW